MASERDRLAAQERREWIAAEEKRRREAADRAEYTKYEKEMQRNQISPLTFEAWRKHIPDELSDVDPILRGIVASANSAFSRLNSVAIDRTKNAELTNQELDILGFDSSDRVFAAEALSIPAIVASFKHFAKLEPRYDYKVHYPAMGDFIARNKLFPSDDHIRLTFNHLWDLHLLPEPQPEPEPEPKPQINLELDRDPILEARKRREKYEREVVVVDPETGKGWTEYQLDHFADSETYRRLMKIPRVFKNPALEPKH